MNILMGFLFQCGPALPPDTEHLGRDEDPYRISLGLFSRVRTTFGSRGLHRGRAATREPRPEARQPVALPKGTQREYAA